MEGIALLPAAIRNLTEIIAYVSSLPTRLKYEGFLSCVCCCGRADVPTNPTLSLRAKRMSRAKRGEFVLAVCGPLSAVQV